MLKMELNRIWRRPIFWVLFLVGLAFAIAPIKEGWLAVEADYKLMELSPYVNWLYLYPTASENIYKLIFPLLAAIAYADSYAEDFNTGFIKNILTKVEKKTYLRVRYIVNFCLGGAIAIFPLVLNFLCTMAVYPLIEPNFYYGSNLVIENSFLPDLYYQHPFWYILLRIFILFFVGGMFASLGLALSVFVKNRYVIVIFPFLLFMAFDILIGVLIPSVPTMDAVFMKNYGSVIALFGYLFAGTIGSYLCFYFVGGKNETI
ncbi:hypothetical protein M3215_22995 [Bacillus cytotoxicus]|uniref:Uncharacterized protein n=1 Tax=Bacillus cytotoxicus TaxID=580165 RepID=A0ACC6ACB3_9BACI|nr:hypothetical protein [Bacillus cytotoxicus]